MRKLISALLTTLYPTPCLVCKAPLAFSSDVLCAACLKELTFDLEVKFCPPFLKKRIVLFSQDSLSFEVTQYLKRGSSKKLIKWVVSLLILRIAKEGEEPFFDSLYALPGEIATQELAKEMAKRLCIPFKEGENTLFLSLDETILPRLEKQRKALPYKVTYLLQLC